MTLVSVEHAFTGATTPISSYDSTKTNLGPLITQNAGALPVDKYAGPLPIIVARPAETTGGFAAAYPYVFTLDNNVYWVAMAESNSTSATRRISLYKYVRSTHQLDWVGFITLIFPFAGTQGTYSVQAMRTFRYTYSTGTVSVSGTTVTGSGTAWKTAGFAGGGRIGFGSTNPDDITTWYEIDPTIQLNSDTVCTLMSPAGTIAAGTAYVMEEWRIVTVITNSTTPTNGGLFISKGLHPGAFTAGGTTISAATTVDGIRANYWFADAATVTMTAGRGLGVLSQTSNTDHPILVLNGSTTAQIFKHNMRAPLSLTSGKDTSNFVFKTGATAVIGTVSTNSNGRIATLNHGPGNGVECFYFVTSTRIYRVKTSDILSNSTTFITDAMTEIPPGGTTTYGASGVMSCVEHSGTIDRLLIMTTGGGGVRSYVTKYNTSGDPMDLIFLTDNKQANQSSTDSGAIPSPGINGLPFSVWVEDGIGFFSRVTNSTSTNQLYVVPVAADWNFAATTNNRLITPAMSTAGATSLSRCYVNSDLYLGSDVQGTPAEPYRVYVRTSGISDNTGSWTLVDSTGDISGISPGSQIQLMFEFRVIGHTCVPSRIHSVAVTYQAGAAAGNFQPSVGKSDVTNKRFAWRHATAYGGSVPALRVRLYDAATGSVLLDDNTTNQASGTFERSIDGTSWSAWTNADKSGNDTYIRYTPTTFADNIRVRALLTEA